MHTDVLAQDAVVEWEPAGRLPCDDLDRDVYCVAGLPIDAIDMQDAISRIQQAATGTKPYLLSTPNVNFLVTSLTNADFRDSLFGSDLCIADGAPIAWMARLVGAPIANKIAGSDLFEALKQRGGRSKLKAFFFGSTESVARSASDRINKNGRGVRCVGWVCPSFGPLDELCRQEYIDEINRSGADFLVAALGARNGQLWLRRNHESLKTPIRAHLGAVINFEAGTVKRAPHGFRKLGLEWLWRIKEERSLFHRYWHDGKVFLRLVLTTVIPLAIWRQWLLLRESRSRTPLQINVFQGRRVMPIQLVGHATCNHVDQARDCFKAAASSGKSVIIDLSGTTAIDSRFLGLLLMLRKKLTDSGSALEIVNASYFIKRLFAINGVRSLLSC